MLLNNKVFCVMSSMLLYITHPLHRSTHQKIQQLTVPPDTWLVSEIPYCQGR